MSALMPAHGQEMGGPFGGGSAFEGFPGMGGGGDGPTFPGMTFQPDGSFSDDELDDPSGAAGRKGCERPLAGWEVRTLRPIAGGQV